MPVIFASTIKPKSLQIPDNIPIITCDNEIVGKMAAEHLVNCGFRHYAYCGYQNISWSAIREAAFRKRLNESGYPTSGYEQPRTPHRQKWEHEQSMLIKWLRALPKPVGIMACSDDRSRDLIEAAKLAEIRIPEDVAVVGVDNDTLVCELSHPTLSSIALDSESAGYKAAELLDRLMNGTESMCGQKILIKPTIVEVRHSTDMLVVDDRDVFAAMSYIKNHAFEPMQVEEVVETTCICRRSLERRFQETIGRSIHAEICRVRVELIKKMLIETNMTQLQIAHAMGYVSIDNLRRFFHREVHTTPLAYRNKFRQA